MANWLEDMLVEQQTQKVKLGGRNIAECKQYPV